MEDILANQQQIIEAVDNLHSNFKKDGAERKTADYVRRRLDTLEQYFTEFHNNHMNLLSFGDQSHAYFSSNQYDQMKMKYSNIKLVLQNYKPPTDRPQTPVLKPPTFQPQSAPQTSILPSQNLPLKENSNTNIIEDLLKKQATNFRAFSREAADIDLNLITEKWEFEDTLKTLKTRWTAIDSLHWELDNELNGSNSQYEEQFATYEKYYKGLKKDINRKMWSVAHIEQSTPKIELATFEGSYTQWVTFKDLFTETVHNNPSLSNAQKMQFLKSKIKGEPEKLIQHLHISSSNYPVCWSILSHRYDNKRRIFLSHLKNILNIPVSQQKSVSHLKRIHDTTYESVNAIKNLGIDVSTWDPFLVCILTEKLDSETNDDYVDSLKSPRELPVLVEFLQFLENKFISMETSRKKPENFGQKSSPQSNNQQSSSSSKGFHSNQPSSSKGFNPRFKPNSNNPNRTYSSNQVISKSTKSNCRNTEKRKSCPICDASDHRIHNCVKLLKMQPSARRSAVANLNLCINCLHYHEGKKCLSDLKCKECNKDHNTILHESFTSKNATSDAPRAGPNTAAITKSSTQQQDTNTFVSTQKDLSEILLATAIIKVQAVDGSFQRMRVLLDQGSQTSIITERAAQLLKLPRQKCNGYISGIGNKENSCKGMISIQCMSLINDFTFETDVFIMKKLVSNLPSHTFTKPNWPIFNQITLADPEFYRSRPIDILLGADVYSLVLLDGICRSEGMLPIAQQTQLGWILSGNCKTFQCNVINNITDIQQFWEMEDIQEPLSISEEDQNCIEFFRSSTSRREDGSYVVKIPFKENFEEKLGDSKTKSVAQFFQIEKTLAKQPELARDYKLFISEYLELGHMTPVAKNVGIQPDCYLSHHCVQRADSSTTKLRVVFNASAKTSTGYSLNDLMCRGPNLQQDLLSLILKWRQFKFAFTADIEKMFRNIWLHADHQNFQKIIWRDHQSQPLKEYKLATVTYGTKAAPFLAMMTLKQLAIDERPNYPNSSAPDILESAMYMDDLMHGAHNMAAAKQIKMEMTNLLKSGGLNLRKWRSNLPELTDDPIDPQKEEFHFRQPESTKALGLRWNPKDDIFIFHPIQITSESIPTKRQFLSEISKIFDPLGWLSPVTIKLKIIFQETWKKELGWDEPVPQDISLEWNNIKIDLPNISQFKIPRWIQTHENDIIELHGFCDASTKAYACVVYCKIQRNDTTHVTLVAGKSKVVPLKKSQSIPRLELSGALLLSKLMAKIISSLPDFRVLVHGWVDSMAVLGWINGDPERWKPFVANRVKMICEIIPKDRWRYVKSKENPADCASRSLTACHLADHSLWWQGPTWLPHYNHENNPENISYTTTEDLRKRNLVNTVTADYSNSIIKQLLEKCSTYRKLIRVLAYVMKFTDTLVCKKKCENYLTLQELKRANETLIKHVQKEHFFKEISKLENGEPLSKKSQILNLNPILDAHGILRIGGRLKHSNINFEMKHPIIIPNKSKLADLIIEESHKLVFHGGVKMTTGFIRQKYWILGGNRATKKRLRMCVKCKRNDPILQHQLMGDLPPSRLNPSRPFYHTGVDYTGHVLVKANKGRGIKTTKGYVAVFVCMVTKAIHLEIVSELTASAFIAALRRMAARRGVPGHIYSDQGTNFIGANRILKQEISEIAKTLSSQKNLSTISEMNIEWHFNAPSWPSAGGLWEAAVKSLKHHLKRVVGEQKLTYEEYNTLLSQLEACLNSRPLCPLTEDPEDIDFLTPAHFLASGPNLTILETENDLRTRWYLVQKIYRDIWTRWKNEYLSQLSVRAKWRQVQKDLNLNDIVVIKDENLPPGKWALGRVVELHPGGDGHVRVVTLRTKNGLIKRPVVKLSLLPTKGSNYTPNDTNIDDKASRKRKPNRISFSAIALSMTLFFLSLINLSQASYNFTPLNNKSVYFDKISNMHLIRDDWHLIVYYDTNPYKEGMSALAKYIKYLETICTTIRDQTPCDGIMLQLGHEFEEIKHYDSIITMNESFVTGERRRRRRRGLIDGVGYVANSLFGVLDQRFAEKYVKDIDLLRENDKHLYSLWKNQTSVVEAEFNLMKRMENTISKHHKSINQKFNSLKESYQDLQRHEQDTSRITEFLISAFTANNLVYSLRRIQDSILDTVTNIYNGKLDFHLISPNQLRSELSSISAQIPKDLAIPVNNLNLKDLYNLIKVRTKYCHKYLIIEIRIPLIERDLYEIFNLIPVPRSLNHEMINVEVISKYAAINIRKDSYVKVTEADLQSCVRQNPMMVICHIKNPIFNLKDDHSLCQTVATTRTCKIVKTPCKNVWKELTSDNKYFYFCCNECHIKFLCDGQITAVALSNAGLLNVEEGCMIKTEDFLAHSSKKLSSKISTSARIDTPEISPINHIFNISIPDSPEIDPNNSEILRQFEAIKKNIEILKQSEPLSDEVSYHDVHQYAVLYALASGMLLAAAIRFWRRRRQVLCRKAARPTGEASNESMELSPYPGKESVLSECCEVREKRHSLVKVKSAASECCDFREKGQLSLSVKSGPKVLAKSNECLQKEDKASSPIFRVFSLPDFNSSNY